MAGGRLPRGAAVEGFGGDDEEEVTKRQPLDPRAYPSWRVTHAAAPHAPHDLHLGAASLAADTFHGAALAVAPAEAPARSSNWGRRLFVGASLLAVLACSISPPLRQRTTTCARGALAWGTRVVAAHRAAPPSEVAATPAPPPPAPVAAPAAPPVMAQPVAPAVAPAAAPVVVARPPSTGVPATPPAPVAARARTTAPKAAPHRHAMPTRLATPTLDRTDPS